MSAAPENDLLFAATAVQLGFLSREQLEQAHSHNNGALLSDHLVQQGLLSAEQSRTVALGVAEQLSQHGNDPGKAAACVPPEIQALFNKPVLLAETTIHESNEQSAPFVAEVTAAFSGAAETSRYVVLRKHQQGGLGLVSVARDRDFNREVAFKEILPKAAHDEQSRQRFVREAEITGALEHPGVVPVYSLGAHADGRPYYAMRFIRGVDLRQAIADYWESPKKDRPLKFRQLIGRFVNVCQTIHYAHSRGVLHRDLK
ncbi:MAG: protein kinase, partial [Planctomycetales bacterium]|nr:protein kinase [Planctomycetales bacterium]